MTKYMKNNSRKMVRFSWSLLAPGILAMSPVWGGAGPPRSDPGEERNSCTLSGQCGSWEKCVTGDDALIHRLSRSGVWNPDSLSGGASLFKCSGALLLLLL